MVTTGRSEKLNMNQVQFLLNNNNKNSIVQNCRNCQKLNFHTCTNFISLKIPTQKAKRSVLIT